MANEDNITDLVGIGIGPFNLSLAALAGGISGLQSQFFERKAAFSWHPGLALQNSTMQTSYLKDMVTPVQPTSEWSFLNFLVAHHRFYDFMAARFDTVSRQEFTQYMAWVAHNLPTCQFDRAIREVDHDGQSFRLRGDDGKTILARAISIGTGPVPYVPQGTPLGPNCFHGIDYLNRTPVISGRRVAVVGGGQTGAEIMLDLLGQLEGPAELTWLSRRSAFWHLQEGGLIDQIYTPGYSETYRGLPTEVQARILEDQKLSSDGLTPATADALYQIVYRRRHLDGRGGITLRPGRTMTELRKNGPAFGLTMRSAAGEVEVTDADVVILATGFRTVLPECLAPLAARLERGSAGELSLGSAYRVLWDGPQDAPVYGLNHGRRSHGIGDPQLSLTAWRSAMILEDLTGRPLFSALREVPSGLVDWPGGTARREMRISA